MSSRRFNEFMKHQGDTREQLAWVSSWEKRCIQANITHVTRTAGELEVLFNIWFEADELGNSKGSIQSLVPASCKKER